MSSAAGLLDPLALLARGHGTRPVRRPAAATAKVNRRRKGEGRRDSYTHLSVVKTRRVFSHMLRAFMASVMLPNATSQYEVIAASAGSNRQGPVAETCEGSTNATSIL